MIPSDPAASASAQYHVITRQFLRVLRGRRSQVAFSRRLGFRSNVAAEWESGRRIPLALTVLKACERVGIRVQAAFAAFRRSTQKQLGVLRPERLAAWLSAQRGKDTATAIAARAGLSRYQVSRFLSGHCQPRLHEFFALVDAMTGRLSDLVAALVEITAVESLSAYHARVVASRRLAFDEPWSSAVLPALECVGPLPCARAAERVAKLLRLPVTVVVRCLDLLEAAGVLSRERGAYVLSQPLLIDTSAVPDGGQRLRSHWAHVAHERSAHAGPFDVFSYNVFSVSREDVARIAQLQREYYQRVRAVVARSAPETVVLLNLQLIQWHPADISE